MPNQFFSPEGDLENYFVSEYWLIDQYIGDQLWTWGSNGYGGEQGTNQPSMPPNSIPVTTFAGGNNWKQISLGLGYTAGIKTDGTLWLWGKGYFGELGNARVTNTSTPITTFTGGNDWKQVALVGSTALAIKTDGTLWTWGYGGVTGNGAGSANISTPITTFVGGSDWKQIAGGWYHALAIKTDGTLWTWGDNSDGALGRYGDDTYNITNTFYKRFTPVTTFAGGTNWADTPTLNPEDLYTLSGGSNFTAAIKTDGTLWTWGSNAQGQLAINSFVNLTPVTTFAGGTNWKQLGVGSGALHTVAVKTDGTLWVWGYNFNGQLGNANIQINALTPVTTFAGGTDWKQVSGGNNHTAAIKTDGTLWCWGAGAGGRLGNFSNTTRSTPLTTFAGGTNWKQVIAGDRHTAAVKTDGTLWSWGYGTAGRLGNAVTIGSILTPVTTFAGGTNWKQVSTSGYGATLAVKTDGTLWGWGSNSNGQLGNASIANVSTPVTTFAGGTNWKQVSCGGYHTTAIKTDGTLWTWGLNDGQLGNNVNGNIVSTPITTFAGGTTWKQVSGGLRHTVALQDDGVNKRLYTFGSTADNQLGIGINGVLENIPGKLGNSNDWKQAAGGRLHSAAVKTDGTLWTWGFDGFSSGYDGQLGINQGGPPRYTPVTTFAGGTNWRQVACGANHTIAIKTNGTLWAWGNTAYGQIGTGPLKKRYTPVTTFAGGTNWADTPTTNPEDLYTMDSGGGHSLAIKTDGTLWIWGYGDFSPVLGINAVGNRSTPVTTFAGGTNWKQVSAGNNSTVAIKTDGTLWTWGRGLEGQLGNNTLTNVSTPITTFAGGTNWKQASISSHIAAIKTDGTLWVWGNSLFGQLGTNDTITRSTPVTTFAGGTNWKQVSAGGSQHTAAIKTDGTLWTWGAGAGGRLGNASITNVSTPVTTFAGGTNWKQVSSSFQNTAAIKTDGTLWTWGSAYNGQLGNNNITDVSTPITTFAGGTNWKQVTGGTNSAAVKTDGTLWTWGYGGYGELGNERLGNSLTPVTTFAGGTNWKQVGGDGSGVVVALNDDGVNKRLYTFGSNYRDTELGLGQVQNFIPGEVAGNHTNWKDIDGGYGHTVATKTDGTLWTWGYHSEGQLGNNTIPDYQNNRYTPVTTFSGGTNWKQVRCGRSHTAAIQLGIKGEYPLS